MRFARLPAVGGRGSLQKIKSYDEKAGTGDDQGEDARERDRRAIVAAVQEGVREGRADQGHQAVGVLREAEREAPPPVAQAAEGAGRKIRRSSQKAKGRRKK